MILFGEREILDGAEVIFGTVPGLRRIVFLNMGTLLSYGYPFINIVTHMTTSAVKYIYTNNSMYPSTENTREFDHLLAIKLLENRDMFIDIMKIVYPIYYDASIVVAVLYDKTSITMDYLINSLIKFIQQRYTLESFIINDIEDLQYIYRITPTIIGLSNIDHDKERYITLVQNPEYWSDNNDRCNIIFR